MKIKNKTLAIVAIILACALIVVLAFLIMQGNKIQYSPSGNYIVPDGWGTMDEIWEEYDNVARITPGLKILTNGEVTIIVNVLARSTADDLIRINERDGISYFDENVSVNGRNYRRLSYNYYMDDGKRVFYQAYFLIGQNPSVMFALFAYSQEDYDMNKEILLDVVESYTG